ncbi:MAG: glycosyltransferase family 2 protein [Lachnospiraceae bacterium]|nr:glycosyltransferase family 2 protein [Lachnospiraceae bacterium]
MQELVSAIITTHNRKNLLLGAVNSVLNQTYQNIECIVIDDASTDGTERFLMKWINDEKIKYVYIRPEESKGGNYARNIGILSAKGKYLAFLDDDDEWYKTKIEKQVEAMEKNENTGFVFCGVEREFNLDVKKRKKDDIGNLKYKDGDLSREVLIHIISMTSTIMVRRNIIMDCGLFDEKLKFWQEYELCIRILQVTNAVCVRENLVLYRVISSDSNRLSNKIQGWEKAVEYIIDKHKKLFDKLSEDENNLRLVYIYIDGFNRARQAKNKKYMVKYAWRAFRNPKVRKMVIRKYLHRSR